MPIRTKNQNTYCHGDWNAICDVCGFKFKASDLKKRWDGFMVCADDWETRHESDFFRAPKEDQSVLWTRPDDAGQQDDDANTAVTKEGVTADTFPNAENTTATGNGVQPDADVPPDGLVEGDFLENGEAVNETVSKAT